MIVGSSQKGNLTTLRDSEFRRALSGPYPVFPGVSGPATGQDSAAVHTLSGLRPPMFLVNSRLPLVTATLTPSRARGSGTPFPEVTGLICRVPSPEFHPIRLRLLT